MQGAASQEIKGFHGILFDEFEYAYMDTIPPDFEGTWNNAAKRGRMNRVVDYAHSAGLAVIANGFSPPDIFDAGDGDVAMTNTDFYLHEDHQINDGDYVTNPDFDPLAYWLDKATSASVYQETNLYG